MKFCTCMYGLFTNIKRHLHLDREFYENDQLPERRFRLNRNSNGHSKFSRPYLTGQRSIFTRRKEIPPKFWTVKKDVIKETNDLVGIVDLQESQENLQEKIQMGYFDIITEIAKTAYSVKNEENEEGKYIYSIKQLRGKSLTDYGLRKIASELNLELRVTRVSEEEKQHIIDVYNNLRINEKRATNDTLVRLLHRNIKTIYNVLNSSESKINWKKRKGAKIIQLDKYRKLQQPSLGIVG